MGHKFTEAQATFIRENIKGRKTDELTEMFNRHFGLSLKISQIRRFLSYRGLKSGIDCRFKPGQIFIGDQFKKGYIPHNYVPVGSERVNKDDYVEIKSEDPDKWMLKHRFIYEEHNGPVPKGYVVIFGDGNQRNFDINNLILVSRKKLLVMNRNNLIKENTDLTRTGTIIADVLIKINERKAK